MVFAKIYLDKDSDGCKVLVFDSVKQGVDCYITIAGNKKSGSDRYYPVLRTKIFGFENIAISPEARALFISRLEDSGAYGTSAFMGDFEISLKDGGYFAFMPTAIKKAVDKRGAIPKSEDANTERRLRADERFVFCTQGTRPHTDRLYKMIEADNEFLKALDISSPADSDTLYKMYFEKKRACEGEPPCDAETIQETPAKYLTDGQKTAVQKQYQSLCADYDDTEWYRNGDYIYSEIIIPKLMKEYGKSFAEIEDIIKIPQ